MDGKLNTIADSRGRLKVEVGLSRAMLVSCIIYYCSKAPSSEDMDIIPMLKC